MNRAQSTRRVILHFENAVAHVPAPDEQTLAEGGGDVGLWTYNHERPNMAIGGITPIQKLAMAA